MKAKDIISFINQFAHENTAFDRDNTGLQVGDKDIEVDKILICVDATEFVVDEAIEKGCNMIISHHPLLFIPLRNITNGSAKGRIVQKLIKHDIVLYASHTNFDVSLDGINMIFAREIGMQNITFLDDWAEVFAVIEVYVPTESADIVRQKMFQSGAGNIGNYQECAYMLEGIGTFKPSQKANPSVGKPGESEVTHETKLEVLTTKKDINQVINTMIDAHPYETPVYRVIYPNRIGSGIGIGVIGTIEKQSAIDFVDRVKDICNTKTIRISENYKNRTIQTVAFCGGSGAEYLSVAKSKGADVMITAECKSHDFSFAVENHIILVSPTHFASESIFIRAMRTKLQQLMPKTCFVDSIAADVEGYL